MPKNLSRAFWRSSGYFQGKRQMTDLWIYLLASLKAMTTFYGICSQPMFCCSSEKSSSGSFLPLFLTELKIMAIILNVNTYYQRQYCQPPTYRIAKDSYIPTNQPTFLAIGLFFTKANIHQNTFCNQAWRRANHFALELIIILIISWPFSPLYGLVWFRASLKRTRMCPNFSLNTQSR